LQKSGKKVLFFTNNSTRSQKAYVVKLAKFGIATSIANVYASSYFVAHYEKKVS
jgi:ribonucleotide monophosphatase NagD (HAD superfamily)